MRVVVTGATGNVGSALVPALAARPDIDEIVGLARRPPAWDVPKVKWEAADILGDDLVALFRDAAVVIHLVWIIQPSRDAERQRHVNIRGLERVLAAVRTAGVGRFIHRGVVGVDRPPVQRLAGGLAAATFAARLQPTGRGWVEAAAHLPLMDTRRIERELGWYAEWSARDALRDLLTGLHERATGPTPALS